MDNLMPLTLKMNKYGLIGRHIDYSFSKTFFNNKFDREQIKASYHNFDLQDIAEFPELIPNTKNLSGLNVTIPYKEQVIPYLDCLDDNAKAIGAVNTIKFTKHGLKGFNTDYIGFQKALQPFLSKNHNKALILGTGGASKAIAYTLDELDITYKFVSRNPKKEELSYTDLNQDILKAYTLIINCTPLGTHPNIEAKPDIPYHLLTSHHLAYDLIYNPAETTFLELARKQGATTTNGLVMLQEQAKAAWQIWNDPID